MFRKLSLLALAILPMLFFTQPVRSEKARLVILADMGNEHDVEQQIMHLLMYANEFDLDGLIAVTVKFLQPASSDPNKRLGHPELFHHLIESYSKVYKNL